jgi:hypothetical protein
VDLLALFSLSRPLNDNTDSGGDSSKKQLPTSNTVKTSSTKDNTTATPAVLNTLKSSSSVTSTSRPDSPEVLLLVTLTLLL